MRLTRDRIKRQVRRHRRRGIDHVWCSRVRPATILTSPDSRRRPDNIPRHETGLVAREPCHECGDLMALTETPKGMQRRADRKKFLRQTIHKLCLDECRSYSVDADPTRAILPRDRLRQSDNAVLCRDIWRGRSRRRPRSPAPLCRLNAPLRSPPAVIEALVQLSCEPIALQPAFSRWFPARRRFPRSRQAAHRSAAAGLPCGVLKLSDGS